MNDKALPIFAVIVAALIFFGYVSPTWNGEIATMKIAIASNNEALAAADEYDKQKSQLTSARNAIDPKDLARLTAFLPDSVNNVRLILDLDALAARSGLSLSNIDVVDSSSPNAKAGTNTNPVGSIDLTLSAVGTYSALQSFLTGVEKSVRLLDVRDLTVKGSATGAYNYQMTVRLYWLR